MFSNKIQIFLYKKDKVKKYLLLLFDFFFSFSFFNVFLLSLAILAFVSYLAAFLRFFFFCFQGEYSEVLEKIQVQIIVFNKKAVTKFSRISNSQRTHPELVKFHRFFFW